MDSYMKFSGSYPSFYFNIFDSLKDELIACIHNARFGYCSKFRGKDIDAEYKLKRYLESVDDEKRFDVLFLHDEYANIEVERFIRLNRFEDFFKKLIVLIGLEIRYEHSSFLMKPFKFIKILYLKHDIRSKVVYGVGDVYLYMGVDGRFIRDDANGVGLKKIEERIKKWLF